MLAIGQSRGGIVNGTESPNYNVPGFGNKTPTYAPATAIDIDDINQTYDEQHQVPKSDHHVVHRLENIVDRIISSRGPPTSSLGNPG